MNAKAKKIKEQVKKNQKTTANITENVFFSFLLV